jgi:hypothetical protein
MAARSIDPAGEKKRKHMAARTKRSHRIAEPDAPTTISLSSGLRKRVDAWAAKQSDRPARSEAMLRLLELGLQTSGSLAYRAEKASEMAAREIDRLIDPSATDEERQVRKRRLIKGPKEFRNIRKRSPEG